MSHIETVRQVLVIKVFKCFLQRDGVPLPRTVLFDGSFFSASRSWVPIVNAEPCLFSVEALFLVGWRVSPGWCPAKRRIGTLRVDKVAFQDGLGIRLHPS